MDTTYIFKTNSDLETEKAGKIATELMNSEAGRECMGVICRDDKFMTSRALVDVNGKLTKEAIKQVLYSAL